MPCPRAGAGSSTTEDASIAVFDVDGELYAIDVRARTRAHRSGWASWTGDVVTCPGHGLRYDVITGLKPGTDTGVRTYPVEVREDGIYVDVDEREL